MYWMDRLGPKSLIDKWKVANCQAQQKFRHITEKHDAVLHPLVFDRKEPRFAYEEISPLHNNN
jgi:hypothetical protein